MPMKNPPHPGEGLRNDINELGLTVTSMAKALGVGRPALSHLVNGNSSISPEMAHRLEVVLGGSRAFWMRLQLAYDLAQLAKSKRPKGLRRLKGAARPQAA